MFDASELRVWKHAARCESEASSYASQRKLDKRIILIALAQRFPSSRSTWWSARSPPCYSLCASQVSTCMSVFISQVALVWLFFPPSSYSSFSLCPGVNEISLIYLPCFLSENCSDNQMNSAHAKKKCTHSLIQIEVRMQFCLVFKCIMQKNTTLCQQILTWSLSNSQNPST